MNEKAAARIQECIDTKAKSLNLSGLGLSEIPKAISQMTWLETLNLSNNQISEIVGLSGLSNLTMLFLDSNQIGEIAGLSGLSNLTTLFLYSNQITEIAGLSGLNKLTTLHLSSNQISAIAGLDTLSNLTTLHLGSNQITEIAGLDNLSRLITLNLYSNQITDIEGLGSLSGLTTLHLNRNKIKKIEGLDGLSRLTTLDFDDNQITEIVGLDDLSSLATLDLQNNQITEVKGLELLTKLQVLFLANNPIKNIDTSLDIDVLDLSGTDISNLSIFSKNIRTNRNVFWEETEIEEGKKEEEGYTNFKIEGIDRHAKKGIYVKDCHNLKKPAPEWVMLGSDMVKQYFEAIEEQGEEELNEVKVLLVGDGGAGKTSLAYRLAQPKEDLPTAEERTRGVEIYDWKYTKDKKKHLIHLWDFGGQVMYDMVHQYFYSQRSLYLLLDSSRSGANENDSRLNQLLQSAELFGKGSPMLIIQNEHTGHEKKMDFSQLQKNYPFLKEFCSVNLHSKEKFKELQYVLKKHINTIPGLGVVLPKKWMKIRKKIERIAKKEDTLSLEEFQKICKKCGVEDAEAQKVLSRYLHQLGVFLHFQDRKESTLQKLIILSREWATKASYKVFDATFMQEREQKGAFDIDDLECFWPEAEFRPFHLELLDLMKQFEICYELPSSKQYIVPRLMDKMPDENYCKGEEPPLHLYYEYTFMPEGLLNRLSVRLHEMIGGDNREMVWNDGVVFEDKGLLAQVRELRQPDKSRIDIKIIGKDAHWMSENLIREIDKINEAFNLERLKVEVKIPCNCKECKKSKEKYFFNFHRVKADLQKPEEKFHSNLCEHSREKVKYHDLLKTISHKAVAEVEEIQKQNKIGRFGENGMPEEFEKLREDIAEVSKKVEDTQTTVTKEAKKTRSELSAQLAKLPAILKANIDDSGKELLGAIFARLDKTDIQIAAGNEWLVNINTTLQALFMKQPTKDDLLKAFQEISILQTKKDISQKDKLKISLPLIPTILKYEHEVSADDLKWFKDRWKKGGWKALFLEDVE